MKVVKCVFWILVFVLGLCSNSKSAIIENRLEGVWREVLNSEDISKRQEPATFIFSKNSDSVVFVPWGFNGKDKRFRYSIRQDTILIHNFIMSFKEDLKGTVKKTYLNFNGVIYERVKQTHISSKYEKIIIMPESQNMVHVVPRFKKFALNANGKYEFESTKLWTNNEDGSGYFNAQVFNGVYSSLHSIIDFQHQESMVNFRIEYYKNGKLKRVVNNTGNSEMKWVYRLLEQHTF